MDSRIDYLADMIQGLVKDHEVDFHSNIESFVESDYLDDGR